MSKQDRIVGARHSSRSKKMTKSVDGKEIQTE